MPIAAPLEQIVTEVETVAPEAQLIVDDDRTHGEAARVERLGQRAQHALLVLGAYPDSWLHQLLGGGTTGHVLKHLWAPIVLVR